MVNSGLFRYISGGFFFRWKKRARLESVDFSQFVSQNLVTFPSHIPRCIYIYNIYILYVYIYKYILYYIYIYIQLIPEYEYPIISISFLLYKANPQFPHGAFQYFVPIPQMTGKYSSNMEHMGMMLFKQRNRSLSSHVIPHLPIFLDQYPLVI